MGRKKSEHQRMKENNVVSPGNSVSRNATENNIDKSGWPEKQLYGTDGLLAAFIGECFLYPINALVTFVLIYKESDAQYTVDNLMLYLTAMSILSFFSLRAGWALHKIKPGAVAKARTFLMLTIMWIFVSVIFSDNLGFANRNITYYYRNIAVLVLINFIFWRSYFSLSKRVKNTYPDYYQ